MTLTCFRDKERIAGADGFVDSARQQHSYKIRSQTKAKSRDQASSAAEDKSRVFTVVDLAAIKQRDQREHDKRLKVIEVSRRHPEHNV